VRQELTCGVYLVTRETEALKLDEEAPVPEKQGAPEDAPLAEDCKCGGR
jgi:hypothetical protein